MTPEVTEELLVDYLYGELDEDQRRAVEAYLDAHPEKREELEALSRTRGVLAQWEDEDPASQVVFVTDRGGWFAGRSWRWVVGGVAAAAAVALMALVDFEVGVRGGRFHFAAGARGTDVERAAFDEDRPLTVREFAAIQGEYFDLTRQLIEASEQRQHEALVDLARDFETKRRQDLYYVSQGLQDVGRSAELGLQSTSAILTHLAGPGVRGNRR